MKLVFALAAAALVASSPVFAGKTAYTTSNGVIVDVNADDFAGRAEYSAPTIQLDGPVMGAALVAVIKKANVKGPLHVQGFAMYNGDWRYYTDAVFRGGEAVNFKRTNSNVGSCRRGCTLTEGFNFEISPEQLVKYNENGFVTIQVRSSKSSDHYLIRMPVAYFDAVREASQG
ncbi:hypothetical protein ACIGGE_16280 [Qipengyuania sp. NPDC077410]|uniref:hypothetical protein n=1 Tax=Qipengyuania sp. NPDC077410 TaxID=3364496 RepID=UPI0037C87ECC